LPDTCAAEGITKKTARARRRIGFNDIGILKIKGAVAV
jgi:hypothetical protein